METVGEFLILTSRQLESQDTYIAKGVFIIGIKDSLRWSTGLVVSLCPPLQHQISMMHHQAQKPTDYWEKPGKASRGHYGR